MSAAETLEHLKEDIEVQMGMPRPVPHHILKLDNTTWWKRAANRIFMMWFRRCFNYEGFTMQARGRHSDRAQAFVNHDVIPNSCRDVPVRIAEQVAIYIRRKRTFTKVIELSNGATVRLQYSEEVRGYGSQP